MRNRKSGTQFVMKGSNSSDRLTPNAYYRGSMMTAGHLIISGESRLFREGLRRILQGPAITVIGEASSLEIAFGLLDANAPADLILCDPSADLDAEFAVMRQIAAEFPTVSVVVITNDLRHSLLDRAVESGARGFLPQDLSPAALEMLLKLVLMG